MDETSKYVIIDQGSTTIRAGTRDSSMPSCQIPSSFERDGTISPLINKTGSITSFDALENVWKNVILQQLDIDSAKSNLLLINNGTTALQQRKEVLKMAFEKFAFEKVLFASTPVTAMYSTGGDTGLVLECGNAITQAFPMYRGYLIEPAIIKSIIAGDNVTELLSHKIELIGQLNNIQEVAKNIKEKHAYVKIYESAETDIVSLAQEDKTIPVLDLPDGSQIKLSSELWECSEVLFNPAKYAIEGLGVHNVCVKAVAKSDIDTRAELYKNVMLIGGSTMIPNFTARLKQEIQKLIPTSLELVLQDQHDKILAPWIGAYVISCTEVFNSLAVTKEEYKERGTNIVNKFFLL